MEICWATVGEHFFDEFKKELEELLKEKINITAETICRDCGVTRVRADNEDEKHPHNIGFYILPFYTNCGAAIISSITYPKIKGIKRIQFIKIIDKCIHTCMQETQRCAAYYTNNAQDTTVISLKNVGFEEIGDRWTNINSDNRIITLRKIYEIEREDEDEPEGICDGCEEENCDNCPN